eukprot:c14255_g1_i1 orf=231-1595(+)
MMMQQQAVPQQEQYVYGAQQEQYVHGVQHEQYALAGHQHQQEHYVQGPTHYQIPQTFEEVRTLWVGDLQYWMDENYLCSCFAVTGEQILSAKVIRNKQTMCSEGYGFVEFSSHTAAERVLQTYSGTLMPQTEQAFRLNWASFGVGEKRIEGGSDHSIFVGDLAVDVTDYVLQETFRSRYPSVRGAKVIIDPITNRSKGYGFVRFGDEGERTRAMSEMNGVYCSSRPMRISVATTKKGLPQQYTKTTTTATAYQVSPTQTSATDNDMNNSTIFVGGLDPMATEADLRNVFGQFGELVYVKIPVGKGCGFVQFMHRSCAEEALQRIHGTVIGQQAVRLSWGRSPVKNQGQVDPNQWNQGYYGYTQGYEGYAYAAQPQDPSAYAYSAYPAYGNYPQQVMDVQAGIEGIAGQAPEYREEEKLDLLATPDVEKLNAAYLELHERPALAHHLWLTTSEIM